jgi:hypothetical protein
MGSPAATDGDGGNIGSPATTDGGVGAIGNPFATDGGDGAIGSPVATDGGGGAIGSRLSKLVVVLIGLLVQVILRMQAIKDVIVLNSLNLFPRTFSVVTRERMQVTQQNLVC